MIKVTTTAKVEIKNGGRTVHPATDSSEASSFSGEADGGVFTVPNGSVDLQIQFNFSMIKRLYFKASHAIQVRLVYDGGSFLTAPLRDIIANYPYLDAGAIIGVYFSNSTGADAIVEMAAAGADEAGIPGPATITLPGDLVIPGKLTVGGLIDPPTGLQLEPRTTQEHVDDLPNRTVFLDARAAEALSFKDEGGVISALGAGGGGGVPWFQDSDKPTPALGDMWIRFDGPVNPSSATGTFRDEPTYSILMLEINIPTPTAADLLVLTDGTTPLPSSIDMVNSLNADNVVVFTPQAAPGVSFGDLATVQDVVDGINAWSMANLGKSIASVGSGATGATLANTISTGAISSAALNLPDYFPETTKLKMQGNSRVFVVSAS